MQLMPECRMPPLSPIDELRKIAPGLNLLDVDSYKRHGQDPLEPVMGLGDASARWCFFGRDPGEQEVRLQKPFVGDAGQKIRAVMREFGLSDPDIFWMNTVPYKPIGNTPWSLSVQRLCQPALLQLLAPWQGSRVITFGKAAFRWFGITNRATLADIDQFWALPNKYSAEFEISLELRGGLRTFTLCPVPHPSGANARWSKSFLELLRARLRSRA